MSPSEDLHNVRKLSPEALKDAKARIKALEKRDSDKLKTDEEKNNYESMVYEMRGWLNDDDNFAYVSESDREEWVDKCNEGEDWLYEDGADAGYKEYQERSYKLSGAFNKFRNRKIEHQSRQRAVDQITGQLNSMRDELPQIEESKPWIGVTELSDVREKVDDYRAWLETKLAAQEEAGLQADPVVTEKEMSEKMAKVSKLYTKVTSKKKPKEKKPKKEEQESAEDESADQQQQEE